MDTDTETRTTTMKAIAYERYGGPEVLEYIDVPKPVPGPEQVLVRVRRLRSTPPITG